MSEEKQPAIWGIRDTWMRRSENWTVPPEQEFSAALADLIEAARGDGVPVETLIAQLQETVAALQEGLS